MISVECQLCGDELEEPGAILLSPPVHVNKVIKDHICIVCYKLLVDEIFSMWDAILEKV